ncbi:MULTISPECIES: hypothetical protein [Pirellulaceae]|uniref:Uncharacterized protein n=1 Tax=Aporhodopirellula rubra TaxID=980271 RepID=A0A7W5E1P0_9BACT|nr:MULTISPECIES: hypothetical protein [Pirellulaceae]EMI41243.1 hypothetical protein RRSWK_06302 [Rhodopirellula sp. SWK7]MBB3208559.1 hypothetical protein [Aporhodopirellula rubra]
MSNDSAAGYDDRPFLSGIRGVGRVVRVVPKSEDLPVVRLATVVAILVSVERE